MKVIKVGALDHDLQDRLDWVKENEPQKYFETYLRVQQLHHYRTVNHKLMKRNRSKLIKIECKTNKIKHELSTYKTAFYHGSYFSVNIANSSWRDIETYINRYIETLTNNHPLYKSHMSIASAKNSVDEQLFKKFNQYLNKQKAIKKHSKVIPIKDGRVFGLDSELYSPCKSEDLKNGLERVEYLISNLKTMNLDMCPEQFLEDFKNLMANIKEESDYIIVNYNAIMWYFNKAIKFFSNINFIEILEEEVVNLINKIDSFPHRHYPVGNK